MGKGGVDGWAQAHVLAALKANPSTPVPTESHPISGRQQYRPSFFIDEAVDAAFVDLAADVKRGDSTQYDRFVAYGSGMGVYPRLTRLLQGETEGAHSAQDVREAFIKDLMTIMAYQSEEIRRILGRRVFDCSEVAA